MVRVDLSGTDNMPNSSSLAEAAQELESRCRFVAASLGELKSTWSGINQSNYRAPEQSLVHGAMDRPQSTAASAAASATIAAWALAAFANTINGIERRRETLKVEIAELEEQERAARGVGLAAGQLGAGLTIWFLERGLQDKADQLAEDYRAAEDECTMTLRYQERGSVDVPLMFSAGSDSFIVTDVTALYNSLASGTSNDPQRDFQQYLALLATLSPRQLSQFLASNPAAPLTPPPLGHTAPGRNKQWWDQLGAVNPEQQKLLADKLPSLVGNLEGIPYQARIAANAAALSLAAKLPNLSEQQRDAYRNIAAAVAKAGKGKGERGLISFDPAEPPLAAVAIGNLDTAGHVTWNIPGMGSHTGQMTDWSDATNSIYQAQAGVLGGSNHAVVAWVGYDSPDMAPSLEVLGTEKADAGADRLAAALNGFNTSRGTDGGSPYISVTAHSYGTTTAAYALTRTDFNVDSVAFYGSAGLDPHWIDEAADLNVKDAPDGGPAVYATQASKDWVAPAGIAGTAFDDTPRISPTAEDFGSKVFSAEGEGDLLQTQGHGAQGSADNSWDRLKTYQGAGYLDPGTQSLDGIAKITTGYGQDVETTNESRTDQFLRLWAESRQYPVH
jgi:hypothetical protein